MTKRLRSLAIIAAVLLAPSMIFAASPKFGAAEAVFRADNTVVVPLEITNEIELAAMDIPLRFSEGVTLKAVEFDDTRVSYFDLKAANINNDENTVVIGLMPQLSPEYKPRLAPGSGVVARLVFEIDDPSVTAVNLEAVRLKNPNHSLVFAYRGTDEKGTPRIHMVEPEFTNSSVALAGVPSSGLPTSFALAQNYPNPFNPTTQIAFDLPVASHLNLTIYNVLGQKVVTLIDGDMDAGSHVIGWDGASYSSGVYFYRISAGNFTETKKMLMLK